MGSPDGRVWIVLNGEMYNYREERARLAGHGVRFRSMSDTEVVLALYLSHGDEFVHHLRGMFAVAVYDGRGGPGRERLVLARDHFGIKPLLYTRAGGGLVFASELKALLAGGAVQSALDPVALWQLLALGTVCQPRTLLGQVRALPPAHRLVCEGGRVREERYWSLATDRVSGLRELPYPEQVARVQAVLAESVQAQLVADVPVGAFLSGGIDSALTVALMAQAHGGALRTFSVGFDASGEAPDETDDAAVVARHLGTDHRRVQVTGADVRENIAHLASALDQPSVDGVNTYFVSRATAGAVKVALSGTGGDDVFAGYPWFQAAQGYQELQRRAPLAGAVRTLLARVARHRGWERLPHGRLARWLQAARQIDFLGTYRAQYQIFGEAGAWRCLAPGLRREVKAAAGVLAPFDGADELPGGSGIDRATALCLRGYTQNQLLRDVDAMSMAHSLEVRVPFLDPIVADTALSLPDEARFGAPDAAAPPTSYRGAGVKRVLMDIGRPLLPAGFDRRTKRGFTLPFGTWMAGPLRDVMHDALSPQSVRRRGLLDPAAVADVLQRFEQGRASWVQPWVLMMLELWFRHVVEASLASASRSRLP
jgi:asparagine synthase (glutamine-hydrolysing)